MSDIHKDRALIVGPSGVMVQVRKPVRLKAGWRLATADDIAQREAAEVENKRKDAARIAAEVVATRKAQADREAAEKAALGEQFAPVAAVKTKPADKPAT